MESSLKEPHRQIDSILTRYSCHKELKADEELQHPEKAYLLKYFLKYYSHLTVRAAHESPLFLKIKRIKKLQKFTVDFEKKVPEGLCQTLLGNHRKSMKEIPQIIYKQSQIRENQSFWIRLALWKIKSFPSIKRLIFPKRKVEDSDDFLLIRKSFLRYLRNMRRLKTLDFFLRDTSNEGVKWMLKKLDGMDRFLGRLETVRVEISDDRVNLKELFKNKTLMAHLTDLKFSFEMMEFDSSLMEVPATCEKLEFFEMSLESYSHSDRTKLEDFWTCMQKLPQLRSLKLDSSLLPFGSFRPKPSRPFSKHKWNLPEQLPKRWKMLCWSRIDSKIVNELDEVEFSLSCHDFNTLDLFKMFIGMVLQKAQKLCSFKCSISANLYGQAGDPTSAGLPFSVEYVSHLYDRLERFESTIQNSSFPYESFLKFDLKKLKAFKNLKIIKLDGYEMDGEGIGGLVSLLQENQKEGEYPVLQLKLRPRGGEDWLRDTMQRIRETKRTDKNLKMFMDLRFAKRYDLGKEIWSLDEFF